MKQLINLSKGVAILAFVFAVSMMTGNVMFASAATVSVGIFSAMRYNGAFGNVAMTGIMIPDFTEKTKKEIADLDEAGLTEYMEKRKAFQDAVLKSELQIQIEAINKANETTAAEKDALIAQLKKDIADVQKTSDDMFLMIKAAGEKGISKKANKGIRQYLEENSTVLKAIIENGKNSKGHGGFSMEITKGTEGASDIGSRDYLGTIEAGIEKQPTRATSILNLFGRKPVSTEYLHFWEENVVTRDAKFVIACATSSHTTKMTWQKRTVELAKIRDMVDVCLDMLNDYDFVESELKMLVDESIMLTADYELLLGASAAATDLLSIDSISSEFNAANVLADYHDKFFFPTIGDLTAAMKGQIYTFGQQRAWNANTVLMNYNDMIVYLHAKDENGVYLFPNFVSGATNVINGMSIVTSPIVPQNTLYVFDSSKGKILDRQKLSIVASFENATNVENELVTFVGSVRLQFHVRNINRDAFMKCSDITAALLAITNPNS